MIKTVKGPLKKPAKPKDPKAVALEKDLPNRLAELEAEVHRYPKSESDGRALKSVEKPTETLNGREKLVQFFVDKKAYAAGRTDTTYSGSNHARGVRHIRFYAAKEIVLGIEGDFEDQQLGSNFRFQSISAYVEGNWEADFMKLTDDLRHYRAKRKAAFKKKRDAENARLRQ
jgi:hypothetical protein